MNRQGLINELQNKIKANGIGAITGPVLQDFFALLINNVKLTENDSDFNICIDGNVNGQYLLPDGNVEGGVKYNGTGGGVANLEIKRVQTPFGYRWGLAYINMYIDRTGYNGEIAINFHDDDEIYDGELTGFDFGNAELIMPAQFSRETVLPFVAKADAQPGFYNIGWTAIATLGDTTVERTFSVSIALIADDEPGEVDITVYVKDEGSSIGLPGASVYLSHLEHPEEGSNDYVQGTTDYAGKVILSVNSAWTSYYIFASKGGWAGKMINGPATGNDDTYTIYLPLAKGEGYGKDYPINPYGYAGGYHGGLGGGFLDELDFTFTVTDSVMHTPIEEANVNWANAPEGGTENVLADGTGVAHFFDQPALPEPRTYQFVITRSGYNEATFETTLMEGHGDIVTSIELNPA